MLGDLAAWRDDVALDLGPGRQRAVFAVLAMRANQVVSREALIDAVWGDAAPAGADGSLYSYISRLKLVLGRSSQTLTSTRSGYTLGLDPQALDVHEFDALREAAQLAWNRRDTTAARAALDTALALWQGDDALGGVDSPFATLHRQRLAELRLAAREQRAEVMTAAADPQAVPDLRDLVRQHPLRESLAGLLMTALHRLGRDTEAIDVFDSTRRRLVETLGMEPGAALRRIHDDIAATTRARTGAPNKPKAFVGRKRELEVLRRRLAEVRQGHGGCVWIEGPHGIGKSALLAEAFADTEIPVIWADRRTINEVESAGPAVIVADDLNDASEQELLAWHRLSKIAHGEPLLVVGACRPLPRRTEVDRLRAGVGPGGGDVLRLTGLTSEEAAQLAGNRTDQSLVDLAAGNPQFLAELVDPATSTEEVVLRRTSLLSSRTQALLRAAAILADQFDLADAATAMGVPVTDLVGAVEEAAEAGFLTEVGHLFKFHHPAARQALTQNR